ncbi:hypothetical protein C6558_35455 [Ensifer sp. NM-2]|uniref:hypothetical protein n=1 Tax=Ensifer sp. NM-2 TaxID=2109730 RepID=UPI000D11CCAD|nr:hypothetical protein [Ensifer sp. NM-2]PSS59988.1 hypothetical protein C6558_35455 [Ensifer sp. NM-2]
MGNKEATIEGNAAYPASTDASDEYQLRPGDDFSEYFEYMHKRALESRVGLTNIGPATDNPDSADTAATNRVSGQLLTPATSPDRGREAADLPENLRSTKVQNVLKQPDARVRSAQAEGIRQSPTTQAFAPEQLKAMASNLAEEGHKEAALFLAEISNGASGSREETLRSRHVVFNLTASGDRAAAISVRDAYKALRPDRGNARRLDLKARGDGRQM